LFLLQLKHLQSPSLIIIFVAVLGFEFRVYTLNHSTSPFL
jgi:hypothetical protein